MYMIKYIFLPKTHINLNLHFIYFLNLHFDNDSMEKIIQTHDLQMEFFL